MNQIKLHIFDDCPTKATIVCNRIMTYCSTQSYKVSKKPLKHISIKDYMVLFQDNRLNDDPELLYGLAEQFRKSAM